MRLGLVLALEVGCGEVPFGTTLLRKNTSRSVSTCAELQGTLDEASQYTFTPGARWLIEVEAEDGLRCEAPLLVAHPQGQAIELRGTRQREHPTDVWFDGAGPGLMVDGGHLGWIDGLTLLAVGQRADSDIGIHVRHGGTLRLGPNMRIRDFPVGLKAEEGAIVHSESAPAVGDGIRPFGLRVEGATQLGVFADSGAVVDARHLCSRGHGKCVTGCERELSCSEPSSESGHGVRAERGATLLLELADVSCHTGHGVLVSDAKLSGRELLVHSNGCDGLHVVGDAVATNPRTRAEANGRDGVHVEQGGLARLDQLNSLRNKRSGIYSDFATIVAEYSVLVFDNQGYAVAADRGGVVLLRQANVDNGSSSPAPLDVCAGTRVFMDVEFVEYQGLPWDQPLTNIVPDRDEPTLHSFVLARDLADVRPFPPGTTECWSRTP